MATRKLYQSDSYLVEFSSEVLDQFPRDGRWAVELGETAFYPDAGGQPHDTGTLGGIPVLDVVEEDGRILHLLAGPVKPSPGVPSDRCLTGDLGAASGPIVAGRIDWTRRFDYMQQHTGQHIFSGAFWALLGAETVGFHIGKDYCTIDLALDTLSAEDSHRAEDEANRIVWENRSVVAHLVEQKDLSRFPLRKVPSVTEGIRVVEVRDFDWSPCGGTHVRSTGEVGIIVIRRWERYKGGIRLEFVCGGRALAGFRQLNATSLELGRILSVPQAEIPGTVTRLKESLVTTKKDLDQARGALFEHRAAALHSRGDRVGAATVVALTLDDLTFDEAKKLAGLLTSGPGVVALLGLDHEKPQLIFARSVNVDLDAGRLLREVAPLIDGRGGGMPAAAQGGGTRREGLREAVTRAKRLAVGELSRKGD
ncbi:MAG: DHHA1 domain-containing protein [Actinobacteria bacterium]|nr:DHHA1 domain-containing protein [Actinomycetota bacterium]